MCFLAGANAVFTGEQMLTTPCEWAGGLGGVAPRRLTATTGIDRLAVGRRQDDDGAVGAGGDGELRAAERGPEGGGAAGGTRGGGGRVYGAFDGSRGKRLRVCVRVQGPGRAPSPWAGCTAMGRGEGDPGRDRTGFLATTRGEAGRARARPGVVGPTQAQGRRIEGSRRGTRSKESVRVVAFGQIRASAQDLRADLGPGLPPISIGSRDVCPGSCAGPRCVRLVDHRRPSQRALPSANHSRPRRPACLFRRADVEIRRAHAPVPTVATRTGGTGDGLSRAEQSSPALYSCTHTPMHPDATRRAPRHAPRRSSAPAAPKNLEDEKEEPG